MTFSKPFNEDERRHIRQAWGWMTSGDIAKALNEDYRPYNEGKRTADGVRRYIAEMTGATVEVELNRNVKDQLRDNGHDPERIQATIEKTVSKLIERPQHKSKT